MFTFIKDTLSKLTNTPQLLISPIKEDYSIESPFGPRGSGFHNGIDFGCGKDMVPIYAVADGKLFYKSFNTTAGAGISIWLKHTYEDLEFISDYFHLHQNSISILEKFYENEEILQGTLIGYVGNTGKSFGAHLHHEIYSIKERVLTEELKNVRQSVVAGNEVFYYDPIEFYNYFGVSL